MPVCIAGMHRSGTSMIAQTLHRCGLYLGDALDLIPASAANPDGYWENRRFVDVNEQLLAVLGGAWNRAPSLPASDAAFWCDPAIIPSFKVAEELRDAFATHECWGWKDPRNSVTLPFWRRAIPDLKVIICARHPLEVASSLNRVDPSVSIVSGIELWAVYNERLLADAPPGSRMVTHCGAYFCDPVTELQRALDFIGLHPTADMVQNCVTAIRRDLRRNSLVDEALAGFEVDPEALNLYARMCEEAAWDEARARTFLWTCQHPATAQKRVAAPLWRGGAAVEEFERSIAARDHSLARSAAALQDMRVQLSDLQDALKRAREEQSQIATRLSDLCAASDRRDEDLLRAMQAGASTSDEAREYLHIIGQRRTVERIRQIVRQNVPQDSTVLVVSRGDEQLLVLHGIKASHFPQVANGVYAGSYPASSIGAIGHLEALRAKGAGFLLIPASNVWWLDHYRDFDRHLRQRYRVIFEEEDFGILFALGGHGIEEHDSLWNDLRKTMSNCERLLGREPAILDWHTGFDVAAQFPDRIVFAPPTDEPGLPYVANSVDVVVFKGSDRARLAEAERVALAAIVRLPETAQSADSRPIVQWKIRTAAPLPTVSLAVPLANVTPETRLFLRSLADTLPDGFAGEIVVATNAPDRMRELLIDWRRSDLSVRLAPPAGAVAFHALCNSAVAAATGEIVVFLDPGTLLLADWLPPLLRVFRDRPNVGAAGGLLLSSEGQVRHAGGAIAVGGAAESFSDERDTVTGHGSDVVRAVEWCSPALLATWRELFIAIGGFDGTNSSSDCIAADYCRRVRERGRAVYYQPDTTAVLLYDSPTESDVAMRA